MTVKEAIDRIKTYKPDRENNQRTYRGQTRASIYLDYLNGVKKMDIARKYNLSSSRVDQIIRGCDKKVNYLVKRC